MNALKKADQLTHGSHQWGFAGPLIDETAALLRRQHEAILKLRVALGTLSYATEWGGDLDSAQDDAEQALKDTENLK